MTHRIASDIDVPNFCWQKLKPLKGALPNLCFDTETVKGYAFLINNSDNDRRDITSFYDIASYLSDRRYTKTVNWFYNLEYDTNAFLRYLPFKQRAEIAHYNTVDYEGFRITIIPKKELKIGRIGGADKVAHTVCYFDLAQFYEMVPLKKLAEQTSYAKVEVEDIKNISLKLYNINHEYNTLINKRCLIDCKITEELADKYTNIINPIVIINKYKSKASIARRFVLENIAHSLRVPSTSLIQKALDSYHAGHIEACKLGIFKNIRNYDINSAYPKNIAELYDTNGVYKHNKEYEPDTAYSFYKINIDYFDDNLTPVWANSHNRNYHPTGKMDIWVTQPEIEFFMERGFDYKIIEANHILKRKDHEQPFKELVDYLYQKRMEAKASKDPHEKAMQMTYKIILNSMYGVTINAFNKHEISEAETDEFKINERGEMVFYKKTFKAGNMYNPLFAAYICANTRVKLFTDFYKYLNKLVSINTDGVYLTADVNVPISKKLGEYSLKKIDKIMVMGSGRYFSFDEYGKTDDEESKFRSIPKSPTEIFKMMQDHRRDSTLCVTRDKPIKLKESVKVKKYKDRFNEFRSVTKNVAFKTDRRFWYDDFNTIGDIFDKQIESRPFEISEL